MALWFGFLDLHQAKKDMVYQSLKKMRAVTNIYGMHSGVHDVVLEIDPEHSEPDSNVFAEIKNIDGVTGVKYCWALG